MIFDGKRHDTMLSTVLKGVKGGSMDIDRPSMDLVYELAKGHYQMIAQWADSLDNKVIGLFGLTTIIIGVITAFTAKNITLDWSITPLCVGTLAFIANVYFALKSFQTREFMIGYDPGILLEQYSSLKTDDVKYWIMKHDGENWERNRKLINDKADALRWAVVAAAAEVIALVAWLVVIRLS
jgi:hypothetical protein